MSLDRLLLIPLIVGHLAFFVLTVNVTHALGHGERTLDRAKVAMLVAFGLLSAAIGWEAFQGSLMVWSWPSLVYGLACVLTGLVVVPASSAWLHRRPRPTGIAEHREVIDLTAEVDRKELIGVGKYAWLLNWPGNESFQLCKVEGNVTLPGLPPALDGLTLLHVSDLHFAPSFHRRYFETIIDKISALPSDLVLFTGDLVDHDDTIEWVRPLLSRLKGRLGSFAILGNHDSEHHPERLRSALEDAGFTDLEGSWATVETHGMVVALGGTSYPWGPSLPLTDRPRADFRVLLSHAPDRFYWAERSGFDLMLSGHNHGGQIRLPLVGPIFMPSVFSRRFDRGYFRKRGLTLHVSQGVAGKHPIRFGGCLPEVSRLTLRSAVRGVRAPHRPDAHSLDQDLSIAAKPAL